VEKHFRSSGVMMDALIPCRFSVTCDEVPASEVSHGCRVRPPGKRIENTRYYSVFQHKNQTKFAFFFVKITLVSFQPVSKGLLFACEDLVCRECTMI
jgi:hypothetical protein